MLCTKFYANVKSVYVGEKYRMFERRKREHETKVRLTKWDIENGNMESAEVRMGKEDGGLAKHIVPNVPMEKFESHNKRKNLETKKGLRGQGIWKIQVKRKN